LSDEVRRFCDPAGLWQDQWWWKPHWRDQIALSDREVRKRISVLEREFDTSWAVALGSRLLEHPLVQSLTFGEGLAQIRSLLGLADHLDRLRHVVGFNRVLADYRRLPSARSAELELFMGGLLHSLGVDVEFIPPKPKKGKTPDILARSGTREFVVECKYLNDAGAERWIKNYQTAFAMHIIRAVPKGVALAFKLHDPFIDISRYGYPDRLTPFQLAAAIDAQPTVDAIRDMLPEGLPSGYRTVGPFGDLVLLPESDAFRGSADIPTLDRSFLLRRLLRSGVLKANEQIRAYGKPGIAVVFYSKAAEIGLVKREFDEMVNAEPEKFDWLMALLVFPEQNILRYVRPFLVENWRSNYSLGAIGFAADLREMLDPVE